jgi:excisionase family DNA binding protein
MAAHNADVKSLGPIIESSDRTPIQPLFTYADIAAALKVSVQTVEMWVKRGKIPSPIYIGVTARFTLAHLQEIYTGVKPAQSFPVSDSPRATQSKAGKHAKKVFLHKARKNGITPPPGLGRSKRQLGKRGGK